VLILTESARKLLNKRVDQRLFAERSRSKFTLRGRTMSPLALFSVRTGLRGLVSSTWPHSGRSETGHSSQHALIRVLAWLVTIEGISITR
jgi:hypothetical protein